MQTIKIITIWIMSIFYCGVGLVHFINPAPFLIIIPSSFPVPILLVYVSGFFEILFGFLLLFEKYRLYAGVGLIFLLITVFPANIFLYVDDTARQNYGSISQQQALVRMFFQIPLIIIAYWHSQKLVPKWFSYLCVVISLPTILYFIWILV